MGSVSLKGVDMKVERFRGSISKDDCITLKEAREKAFIVANLDLIQCNRLSNEETFEATIEFKEYLHSIECCILVKVK